MKMMIGISEEQEEKTANEILVLVDDFLEKTGVNGPETAFVRMGFGIRQVAPDGSDPEDLGEIHVLPYDVEIFESEADVDPMLVSEAVSNIFVDVNVEDLLSYEDAILFVEACRAKVVERVCEFISAVVMGKQKSVISELDEIIDMADRALNRAKEQGLLSPEEIASLEKLQQENADRDRDIESRATHKGSGSVN